MGEGEIETMGMPPDRGEYVYPDGSHAGLLTWDEALKAGFCPACGAFVAGIDGEIPYLAKYEMCYDCCQEELEDARYHSDDQWDL